MKVKYEDKSVSSLLLLCLTACSGSGVPEISKLVTPGNDEKEPVFIPQPLFFTVSAGNRHSLAIYGRVNETWNLYAWGHNSHGQLGDGTSRSKNSPKQIDTSTNNTNWVSVAAGKRYSLAINKAGELYAWGEDTHGRLGDGGANENKTTPVKIQNPRL